MSGAQLVTGVTVRRRCKPKDVGTGQFPTVTVVIPCFNYARYLRAAVESVLIQEGALVDIVIVDDASTDKSLAVARELASRHRRIRVMAHPDNLGAVRTFNDGLAQASGEFLVRLDADDMLSPGSIARSVAVARAFPSVGLVYGHPVHFSSALPPVARQTAKSWTVWPGRMWLAHRCRTGTSVITAPEVLMRRSVVDIVGGQQPLAHAHDTEMWMRMAAFADVAHIEGADQAFHRTHPGSLSSGVDIMTDLLERRAAFSTLFSGPAASLAEAPELLRMAMRSLAAEALTVVCRDIERRRHLDTRVSDLIDFAQDTYGEAEELPQWRAVNRRRRIEGSSLRGLPIFAGPMIARKIRMWRNKRKWAKNGC
jgi:hypothetical protein